MRTPWIISATEFLRNSVGAFAAVIAIGLAAPAFAQGVDHKQQIEKIIAAYREVRVPVERDHGFRWKMITESGGT